MFIVYIAQYSYCYKCKVVAMVTYVTGLAKRLCYNFRMNFAGLLTTLYVDKFSLDGNIISPPWTIYYVVIIGLLKAQMVQVTTTTNSTLHYALLAGYV